MDSYIKQQIPVTAVIPTANRRRVLKKTIESLARQDYQPAEIIIVDASDNDDTEQLLNNTLSNLVSVIHYKKANIKGAAAQRNQGVKDAQHEYIFFMDDDIVLEDDCVKRLWDGLQSEKNIGAVNALITNQHYQSPGKVSLMMYKIMSGTNLSSYAGKCIGPAWNLLPEDNENLPERNQVEWLNTTCTIYRKEALPNPVFPDLFQGYSLLEDVALSLKVAKKWKLFNVRTARVFHDSQPGTHKSNVLKLSKMELVNRHYVMTEILERNRFSDHCKLFLFELFGIVAMLATLAGWKNLIPVIIGKLAAIGSILFTKINHE